MSNRNNAASNIAIAAAGSYIGYKIGQSISKNIKIKRLKKKIFEEISYTYGVLTTLDVLSVWEQQGNPDEFDSVDTAELVSTRYLYKYIADHVGEGAADFIEQRIEKAATKGIKIDLDNELTSYALKNNLDLPPERMISNLLMQLKQHRESDVDTLKTDYLTLDSTHWSTWFKTMAIFVGFLLLTFIATGISNAIYQSNSSTVLIIGAILTIVFSAYYKHKSKSKTKQLKLDRLMSVYSEAEFLT